GTSRAHLVGDKTSSISRNGARLRDRRLEIPAERDGEDQLRPRACRDLDRLRQNDGDRGVEHAVVDPQHRAIAALFGRDRRMRNGPPFGDLGVVGPPEARSPAPPRHDNARLWTRRDADELREAGPAGRRDRPDLAPSALVLVYPV